MSAKLVKTEECFELNLSGDPNFKDSLSKVKSIAGRRFNGEKKVWEFPLEVDIAERIIYTIRPEADSTILGWVKENREAKASELTTPLPEDADDLLIEWAPSLYAYQRASVKWLAEHPKCILADDMGLGKTFQALSAVIEHTFRAGMSDGPKLIICPNSVKGVWAREIRKWLGNDEPFVIVDANTKDKRRAQIQKGIEDNAWIIVNWEQIRAEKREVVEGGRKKKREFCKIDLFQTTQWNAVIADEAHRAKNRKALTTRGLWLIDAPIKYALTGTPIMNSPDEIWSVLKWLFPKEYTSYWRFFDTYVDSYEGHWGKVIVGVKNPDALRFELSKRLVRRTKGQVLDLPEKTRVTVPVELHPKQRKMYNEAEKELWFQVEQDIKAGKIDASKFAEGVATAPSLLYQIPNGAARTVRLRQVASSPALLGGEDVSAKLDTAQDLILDAQPSSGLPKQFVVFSEFVDSCKILAERLRKKGLVVATFTGEVPTEERTAIEDQFQRGEIDVVIGTIEAMHLGVTLTAADSAIFLEQSWVPAKNEQAADRLHRAGQKNNVTIYVLEAQNTVDDGKIAPTNRIKELIVGSILERDDVKEK